MAADDGLRTSCGLAADWSRSTRHPVPLGSWIARALRRHLNRRAEHCAEHRPNDCASARATATVSLILHSTSERRRNASRMSRCVSALCTRQRPQGWNDDPHSARHTEHEDSAARDRCGCGNHRQCLYSLDSRPDKVTESRDDHWEPAALLQAGGNLNLWAYATIAMYKSGRLIETRTFPSSIHRRRYSLILPGGTYELRIPRRHYSLKVDVRPTSRQAPTGLNRAASDIAARRTSASRTSPRRDRALDPQLPQALAAAGDCAALTQRFAVLVSRRNG
jgi:hypothetical protein